MQYCRSCLYPETKPDLFIDDDGVCSACRNYQVRENIDWNGRLNQFRVITDRYKFKDGGNYDCLIPVSGGKDSTYQVIRVL